jgi:hypothetical protein
MPAKAKDKPLTSTVARARAFLASYRRTCNVTKSAKAAGVQPRQHYRWLLAYPGYAAAFGRAQPVAAQFLEDKAVEFSTDGWLEPVFYQGQACGAVRRHDVGLLQFLLRGANPEKYNRDKVEVTGKDGGPIDNRLEVVFVTAPKT